MASFLALLIIGGFALPLDIFLDLNLDLFLGIHIAFAHYGSATLIDGIGIVQELTVFFLYCMVFSLAAVIQEEFHVSCPVLFRARYGRTQIAHISRQSSIHESVMDI